jgi:hypothetical protein
MSPCLRHRQARRPSVAGYGAAAAACADMRRVALSATVSDPEAYQGWLAPHADVETVDLVIGRSRRSRRKSASCFPEEDRSPGRAIRAVGPPST